MDKKNFLLLCKEIKSSLNNLQKLFPKLILETYFLSIKELFINLNLSLLNKIWYNLFSQLENFQIITPY